MVYLLQAQHRALGASNTSPHESFTGIGPYHVEFILKGV